VGASRACYTGAPGTENVGECHDGTQVCQVLGEFIVWGPCTGDVLPTDEMCSMNKDYNCNGMAGCADPICVGVGNCCATGAMRSCYDGPANTAGVGVCKMGEQTCTAQHTWPADCPGEVVPGTETGHCGDGIDNDCNGKVDCLDPACGGMTCCTPGATRACYDGPSGTGGLGICKLGTQVCLANGTWQADCPGEVLPGTEAGHCSDGMDNDCNGKIDCLDPACSTGNAACCVPGQQRACYDGPMGTAGVGICKSGNQTCTQAGTWPMDCPGEVLPGSESGKCSDGIDNDCNGKVDCLDAACSSLATCCMPGAMRQCYDGPAGTAGVGVCMMGTQVCSAAGTWPANCPGEVVPGSESAHCGDNLDNDCNGFVDCLDSACTGTGACCSPGTTRSCYDGPANTAGVGICKMGNQTCTAGGTWPATCPGEVLPGSESGQCSDGIDNDCDGKTDCLDPNCSGQAGCCTPNTTRSCYDGPANTEGVGICKSGTQTCTAAGTWPATCPGEVLPGTETGMCTDTLDNDCNGKADCADDACTNDPACCIPIAGGPTGPVTVTITADNAYSFGYGDINSIPMTGFVQGQGSTLAGQIFNCYNSANPNGDVGPEVYNVSAANAAPGTYLYVIAWCDSATTQGVLGQFKRSGGPLYTGDSRFQVCATGLNYPGSGSGPTLATINAQITACNAGTATTSKGWVDANGAVTPGAVGTLAVGESNANDGMGVYAPVCPSPPNPTANNTINNSIDTAAQWMWYCPSGSCPSYSAFQASNTAAVSSAFLIFRLPAAQIGCQGH
jgi:hypothetical protein